MANMRRKRCANPACRKVFTYTPDEKIHCPWCGDASCRADGYRAKGRLKRLFHFGVSMTPALQGGWYTVPLERLALPKKKLNAIKAYRDALAGKAPSLKESKAVLDGVDGGRPYTMTGLTADQVLLLMQKGHMDLSYSRSGKL